MKLSCWYKDHVTQTTNPNWNEMNLALKMKDWSRWNDDKVNKVNLCYRFYQKFCFGVLNINHLPLQVMTQQNFTSIRILSSPMYSFLHLLSFLWHLKMISQWIWNWKNALKYMFCSLSSILLVILENDVSHWICKSTLKHILHVLCLLSFF